MQHQFLNAPGDVQWLLETHLKNVPLSRPFQSFVITGNEDAPNELRLYDLNDPLHSDAYRQVLFSEAVPTVTEVAA